jgi:hypothetical protein
MHGDIQSLAGDFSRYRAAELRREADAERMARTTRRARLADSRSATRRFARAAIAAVVWPVKH